MTTTSQKINLPNIASMDQNLGGSSPSPHRGSKMLAKTGLEAVSSMKRGSVLGIPERPSGFQQQYGSMSDYNSQSRIPSGGELDPLTSYLAYEATQKKQKKIQKNQEDKLREMMENQEKLLEQINSQKRIQMEIEGKYKREISRAREIEQMKPRISDSREKEYANLDMLNKLGASMKNGDYSIDFLFGRDSNLPPRNLGNSFEYEGMRTRPREVDEVVPSGASLIQRGMRGVLGNRSFNNNQNYSNEPRAGEYSMPSGIGPGISAAPNGPVYDYQPQESYPSEVVYQPVQKRKKKKKKENIISSMLPLVFLSQMGGGGGRNNQENKLLSALDSQNKVLASLSTDVARHQKSGFDSEKNKLEQRIEELEKKLNNKPRGLP